eukprot:CAMPEP_0172515820 /NCGR_PEP_ID=MMETSP1066-20121228/270981_1 /TAXON_ID=671091 /ORGANISM="Coscinodiscus wailesii, Strain CCMP2513" /LENGTH=614 /DNA_ID=CAMNT_0013297009 /DNA_START=8 /DNA_END=1852 /DNA_ORIENTATION=+
MNCGLLSSPDRANRNQNTPNKTVPGQFDDAPDDDGGIPTLLAARQKMLLSVSTVSQSTNPSQINTPLLLPQDENEQSFSSDDEYDDDYQDDNNYDDLINLDDTCLTSTSSHANTNTNSITLTKKNVDLSLKSRDKMSHSVTNTLQKMNKLSYSKRQSHTGRDDRATMEQCLDPRTRLILFRLLSTGTISLIDGCLSTGKEANVYYAKGSSGGGDTEVNEEEEYAIKIYKTSILVFRDRDKYVAGEHRWRRGYCKSNPRKMVKTWAEKEMRNYRRIYNAGIPCPEPRLLKSHVLVMGFLGKGGWPSPRLKDANLSPKRMREAYVQTIKIMRDMFQKCQLVHGDLSEYNLLWHDSIVYVIDVSQSVESSHPSALDFLRKDCANVNDFFRTKGKLDVMTTRQLFEYVTTEEMEDEEMALDSIMKNVEETLERLSKETETIRREELHKVQVNEAVFMSQFLPRSLNQVKECDMEKIEDGDVEETYALAVAYLTGNDVTNGGGEVVKDTSHRVTFQKEKEPSNELAMNEIESDDSDACDHVDSDDEFDSDNSDDSSRSGTGFVKKPMTPEDNIAARKAKREMMKANKKAVKQERSEKRLTKMKKKDKKRAIKKSKGKKK